MEWLKEIIGNIEFDEENKGAAEEITKAIKSEMAKHMIPKTEFNAKNEALKELQEKYNADISERDNQLEGLKKSAGNAEELQAKIKEYETNNSNIKAEYDSKLAEMQTKAINDRKNFAVREALNKLNPKEGAIDLISSKIDLEKLSYDGDNLIGLNDIVENVKNNYGWALGETKISGTEPNVTDTKNTFSGITKDQLKNMSAEEINANWDAISKSGVLGQ